MTPGGSTDPGYWHDLCWQQEPQTLTQAVAAAEPGNHDSAAWA